MQYLIYLTNGVEESCVSISGNKESAKISLNSFKETIKRDSAWFELREYDDWSAEEYRIISQ